LWSLAIRRHARVKRAHDLAVLRSDVWIDQIHPGLTIVIAAMTLMTWTPGRRDNSPVVLDVYDVSARSVDPLETNSFAPHGDVDFKAGLELADIGAGIMPEQIRLLLVAHVVAFHGVGLARSVREGHGQRGWSGELEHGGFSAV
jgi:hypothetical protein